MKKITLWIFPLFTCLQISTQTSTIVVGVNAGTPNAGTINAIDLSSYSGQTVRFINSIKQKEG